MTIKQWVDKKEDWLKQPASMFGVPRAVIIIGVLLGIGAIGMLVIISTP